MNLLERRLAQRSRDSADLGCERPARSALLEMCVETRVVELGQLVVELPRELLSRALTGVE